MVMFASFIYGRGWAEYFATGYKYISHGRHLYATQPLLPLPSRAAKWRFAHTRQSRRHAGHKAHECYFHAARRRGRHIICAGAHVGNLIARPRKALHYRLGRGRPILPVPRFMTLFSMDFAR